MHWYPCVLACYVHGITTLYSMLLYITVEYVISGGNLGFRPPPTLLENDEFLEILIYKRAKNSLFECKWGGLSEIWKFCRKFRRLCPPPTGKSEFPPLYVMSDYHLWPICRSRMQVECRGVATWGNGGQTCPPLFFDRTNFVILSNLKRNWWVGCSLLVRLLDYHKTCLKCMKLHHHTDLKISGTASSIIGGGGGGEYSYICVHRP
jgi:hypothetical protein